MKVGDLVKVFDRGTGIVCGECHWEKPGWVWNMKESEGILLVDVMLPDGFVHSIVAEDCEVISENR